MKLQPRHGVTLCFVLNIQFRSRLHYFYVYSGGRKGRESESDYASRSICSPIARSDKTYLDSESAKIMVTGDAHANHELASASLRRSTIILDAFARLNAFGDFSKERCRLSLMNRNGMLIAVRGAVMFHG